MRPSWPINTPEIALLTVLLNLFDGTSYFGSEKEREEFLCRQINPLLIPNLIDIRRFRHAFSPPSSSLNSSMRRPTGEKVKLHGEPIAVKLFSVIFKFY